MRWFVCNNFQFNIWVKDNLSALHIQKSIFSLFEFLLKRDGKLWYRTATSQFVSLFFLNLWRFIKVFYMLCLQTLPIRTYVARWYLTFSLSDRSHINKVEHNCSVDLVSHLFTRRKVEFVASPIKVWVDDAYLCIQITLSNV